MLKDLIGTHDIRCQGMQPCLVVVVAVEVMAGKDLRIGYQPKGKAGVSVKGPSQRSEAKG